MNNKKLGTEWEREFCDILKRRGYWVHFISPDNRGAQPFDIVAVKYGLGFAYDCKTCDRNIFSLHRLEDNQIYAFEKWMSAGNTTPMIAVKHDNKCYLLDYAELKEKQSIKLTDEYLLKEE